MSVPTTDLTNNFPRSPRDTSIAGYVIAARALDKCRAVLNETAGEYHTGCPLDQFWLDFTEIKFKAFRNFVATGADDEAVSAWIIEQTPKIKRRQIIAWNNKMRDLQISKLPIKIQEFLEEYIPQYLPQNKIPHVLFDVYDIEENRI